MSDMKNEIKIGGSVGGNVVAGSHNTIGQPAVPSPLQEPPEGFTPRMGFVVDMIGFGRRDADERALLQRRLDELLAAVVADIGYRLPETENAVAGDSKVIFLPVGADSSRVLPTLISAASQRIARDNARYRDRMRLRMAIGSGLLGNGPLGFTGDLVVDLHRLVDSPAIRRAMTDHTGPDLAILVTHTLHDEVIRPGFLSESDFSEVTIMTKEYTAQAWLRLC